MSRSIRILWLRMIGTLSKCFCFTILSPDGLDIFNDIEGTYLVSLLKKKANAIPSVLEPAHAKALLTLQLLSKNMIAGDVPISNIIEYYQEATRENVILLILRCKKMYEARMEVRRIIKSLIMQQEMLAKLQPLLNKGKGGSYSQQEIDEIRKLHRHT